MAYGNFGGTSPKVNVAWVATALSALPTMELVRSGAVDPDWEIVNHLRETCLVPLHSPIAPDSWLMSIPKGADERGSRLFIPAQQESILVAASMLLRYPQSLMMSQFGSLQASRSI
jgi:hypothetical protein